MGVAEALVGVETLVWGCGSAAVHAMWKRWCGCGSAGVVRVPAQARKSRMRVWKLVRIFEPASLEREREKCEMLCAISD